jgi:hypothetical protein
MTDILRAALAADQDTPAGVHVAAVRARAARIRRTRYAMAGIAVLATLAVLVPVAVLQRDRPPTVVAASPPLACPERIPAAPAEVDSDGRLLPSGPVTGGLVCTYGEFRGYPDTRRVAGTARLTAAEASSLAARLAAGPSADNRTCTQELGPIIALQFAGPGWTTTLRVELYGCGMVSNGTVTRVYGVDQAELRELEARATR